MIEWNILPVDAAGVTGSGYLGMALLPGRALFFAVGAGQEIVLCARPRETGVRPFRGGRKLQVEYRRFPPHAPERDVASLLEVLSNRILAREDELASRLGAATLRVSEQWHEDDVVCLRLEALEGQEPVLLKLGPRGRFCLDLFHWSASVASADGRPAPELSPSAQASLLDAVGHLLFELPLPGSARRGMPESRGPARYFYADLGDPEGNSRRLSDLHEALPTPRAGGDATIPSTSRPSNLRSSAGAERPPSGPVDGGANRGRLVLSLDVPSLCDNRCLFCASDPRGVAKVLDAQPQAAMELERLLAALRPEMESAGEVDVSLAGRDAFAMPGIAELAARIRAERLVSRLTAVTPGCRLTDVTLVERLRGAGIDAVVLTLLGPDASTHDRVAGRKGAYRDLLTSIRNLKNAGIGWELNTVVVRQNLRCLARTVARAEQLGARIRVCHFLSEPEIPDGQVRRCMPRYSSVARIAGFHRDLFERAISSIQYVPLCVLPEWARGLAGDSSRQSPEPPDVLPSVCAACPEYQRRCISVGRRYLRIFGEGELGGVGGR